MQVVSKLSTKTIVGTVKPADLPKEGTKPLFRVMGIVSGTKTGQSTFGDWLALTGQFKAIVFNEDGEVKEEFRSGTCFLPDIATDLIIGAMPEDKSSLEFAFDIGAMRFDSAQGYKFTVHPLVSTGASDPFAALESKLPAPMLLENKDGGDEPASDEDVADPVEGKAKKTGK